MHNPMPASPLPDEAERDRAIDARRSVLVQAPAGSGKTYLLTQRFLRLLAVVDEPGQIVAITFTKAAAAEMRHRIQEELEKAERRGGDGEECKPVSMERLAAQALTRSRQMNWNLIEQPAQLRISTIDSFCRELAVQQPLLSGLGGGLEIFDDQKELYRRAARATLEEIDKADPELREALSTLLLWRDNNWREMEELLVEMLGKRDRWMQDFVFDRDLDWAILRERLERPFQRAVRGKLDDLDALLNLIPGARQEVLELTRFVCGNPGGEQHRCLAEMAELPAGPFIDVEDLEAGRDAFCCLAAFLQTQNKQWRSERGLNASCGFPNDVAGKAAKKRFGRLIASLDEIDGFQSALAGVCDLPPARYTGEDWEIVRACFLLLQRAAAHLRREFAEAGAVDYTEIAQLATYVLNGENGIPDDGALAFVDGIQHLLVDEFQDTSRRQYELISSLIAAWSEEREGQTCFLVGDPMQSIYSFRDADAELFAQVRDKGLQIPRDLPLMLDLASLRTNFRTERSLVERMNVFFDAVFAENDGSGVAFERAEGLSGSTTLEMPRLCSHFKFVRCATKGHGEGASEKKRIDAERRREKNEQIEEIIEIIRW